MTDLFDYMHSRPTDPLTSHEAAAAINITAQALRILRAYRSGAALLDHDAYFHAGFPPNARDGQRCSDLRKAGFIERTGGRDRTPSGRAGYLCRITPAGLAYLKIQVQA
jgi:hypothetical protein